MSSESPAGQELPPRAPSAEVLVPVFSALIAGPFCSAGATALMNGNTRGIIGFLIGVPIGLLGATFHWWQKRLSRRNFRWLVRTADRGWPIALSFAFLYVAGFLLPGERSETTSQVTTPSVAEIADAVVKRLPKSSTPMTPSADEIAAAVIQRLPQSAARSNPVSPAVAVPPYVNPIHTAASKWGISNGIRSSIIRNNLTPNCRITITRLPVTYAEDLAADLKSVLDTVGWKYDEHLATTTVDKEISVRVADGNTPSSTECAVALSSRLQNDGRTRTGGSYNVNTMHLVGSDVPDFLKSCSAGCIEVTIGNDDTSR